MEEAFISEDVRKRLILSGLRELGDYGIRDFSLRRVAIAAGVSCAAPYRHFKDKDELVLSIIEYVKDGWDLLASEILKLHGVGTPASLVELSVMLVKFWLGNSGIRSILLSLSESSDGVLKEKIKSFDEPIISSVGSFSFAKELSNEECRHLTLTVLTLIYGSIGVVSSGIAPAADVISNLKNKITLEIINLV